MTDKQQAEAVEKALGGPLWKCISCKEWVTDKENSLNVCLGCFIRMDPAG